MHIFQQKMINPKDSEEEEIHTTPNCSDAFAFQSRRLVSSLPEMT